MTALLTIGQVAEMLACSERTVRRLRASGELIGVNVGAGAIRGQWKFEPHEVQKFLNRKRQSNHKQIVEARRRNRRRRSGLKPSK